MGPRATSPCNAVITEVTPSCQCISHDDVVELSVAATREEEFSDLIVANHDGLEPLVTQHAQPSRPREQAEDVTVVSHARAACFVAQQNRKVDLIGRVARAAHTDCKGWLRGGRGSATAARGPAPAAGSRWPRREGSGLRRVMTGGAGGARRLLPVPLLSRTIPVVIGTQRLAMRSES